MKMCNKDEYKRALAITQRSQGILYKCIASMLGVRYRTDLLGLNNIRKLE
jgi:hypothetical protein